jgi:putative ATPase
VPLHLRNAPTKLMKGLGYGKGYQYAHDYKGAVVEQQHLPDKLRERRYYLPKSEELRVTSEELRENEESGMKSEENQKAKVKGQKSKV